MFLVVQIPPLKHNHANHIRTRSILHKTEYFLSPARPTWNASTAERAQFDRGKWALRNLIIRTNTNWNQSAGSVRPAGRFWMTRINKTPVISEAELQQARPGVPYTYVYVCRYTYLHRTVQVIYKVRSEITTRARLSKIRSI